MLEIKIKSINILLVVYLLFNNSVYASECDVSPQSAISPSAVGGLTVDKEPAMQLFNCNAFAGFSNQESRNLKGQKSDPRDAISLSFGNNNETVTAKLAKQSGTKTWGFSATSPYDENDPGAILGNLDGLADKNKLSFFFAKSNVSIAVKSEHQGENSVEAISLAIDQKESICKSYWLSNPDKKVAAETQFREDFELDDSDTVPAADLCQLAYIEDDQDLAREFLTSFIDLEKTYSWQWGIEGSIAPDSYKFVEESNQDKSLSSSDTDYSLELFYRRSLGAIPYQTWTAGVRYEKTFDQSAEQNICQSFDSDGSTLSCSNKRIGAPEESEQTIVFLDYGRRFLTEDNKEKGGIRVKISRDLDNDISGIEVPIWFVRDQNDALMGGVQLDWNDKTDDVGISIFVATPFDLF